MRRLLAAAAVAVLLGGCGGDPAEPAAQAGSSPPSGTAASPAAQPVGDRSAGEVVQFADCDDWKAGSKEERLATVRALRDQLTPQRSKTAASPLSDERAYEVFERACKPEWAGSLRLYKLYVKVQGFEPLRG